MNLTHLFHLVFDSCSSFKLIGIQLPFSCMWTEKWPLCYTSRHLSGILICLIHVLGCMFNFACVESVRENGMC